MSDPRLDPRVVEYLSLKAQVLAGKPHGWMERYLKVRPKAVAGIERAALVPMRFTAMQELAYRATLGGEGWRLGEKLDVVYVKPREAESTTLGCGYLYAFASQRPGITCLFLIDNEAKMVPIIQPIFEVFYDKHDPEWNAHLDAVTYLLREPEGQK